MDTPMNYTSQETEVIFPVKSKKQAVKAFENLSDMEISQVNSAGKHRKIETKDGKKIRLIYQDEPFRKFGKMFSHLEWDCPGVSLNKTAFQEVLKQDYDHVVHITEKADIFISRPEDWRDFLNDYQTLWEPEKTEEKVISMPVEELENLNGPNNKRSKV